MYFYDLIIANTVGTTFLIREDIDVITGLEKIQLLLGDTAVILKRKDLSTLLKTIVSSKKYYNNPKKNKLKQIKFATDCTTLFFKSSEPNISHLEDLVKRTIFELEFAALLDSNNILI